MKTTKHEPSNPKINLLEETTQTIPKKNIFKISKFIIYLFVTLVVGFLVFSYQVLFTNNSLTQIFAGNSSIFQQLNTLAGNDAPLKGESDDRINILLLGMGGAGHDGPYLTDTLILVSIQPSTKKVAMVSIPRDLLVEIPGSGYWKINNANAFGEQTNPGNGGALAKEVVSKTFDIPIHYYLRIDFSGFEKIIDELGGIKVYVDNSFTDYQFPTEDHKYQVISFEEGWQTMDGDTALDFVRSRHGNNGEGSDFARAQRQQKVIQALKDRLLSYNTMLSPLKINSLLKDVSSNLRTDLELWELIKLGKLAKVIDTDSIITEVLNDSPDNYLYANIVNEAYVLQPKGGDFSLINSLIKNVFEKDKIVETQTEKTVKVEIRNGTTIPGLASTNSQKLKLAGYKVIKIGNAQTQDYKTNQIYLFNKDVPEDKLKYLEETYNTTIIDKNIPDWVSNLIAPDIDIFVILGQDKANN